MIELKMVITLAGQAPAEYKVRPVTQVAAERHLGCSLMDVLDRRRLEDIYWLGWHAATLGAVPFDDWLAQVEEIDVATGGAVVPTLPAP